MSERVIVAMGDELHEWPLVVFTALVIPGAGILAARLLADVTGWDPIATRPMLWLAMVLLVAGVGVSLSHLGQPLRAGLVLRRARRNALGSEVALAGAVLLCGLLSLLAPPPSAAARLAALAAGACSLALLAAIGLVYRLPGRWPWHTALVCSPAISGLALGLVVLAIARTRPPAGAPPMLVFVVIGLLVLDLALSTIWWRTPNRAVLAVHADVVAERRMLLAARGVLFDLVPAVLVLAGVPAAAAVSLAFGLLLDRFNFYALAMVESTEAQVADVERMITSGYTDESARGSGLKAQGQV